MSNTLQGMTYDKWVALSPRERDSLRDLGGLTPQLIGLEGWRVEAIEEWGDRVRFIVGRSTGWRPCHLAISRRNAHGGPATSRSYKSVRKLYKVR